MSGSAWRVALFCILSVISCSSAGDDGLYVTDSKVPEVTVDLQVELPPDIDVPDTSQIELEPVESLHVKFTDDFAPPSFAAGSSASQQPFVQVFGSVLGAFDSFYLKTDFQDDPIIVEPDEAGFFQAKVYLRPPKDTGTVLEALPTTVWAVAQNGESRAYDTIVVVANSGFSFNLRLSLTPDVLFAKEPNELLFTLNLNEAGNFLTDQVWVMEVESDCATKVAGSARQLLDDGQIDDNGDQLALDQVYSTYIKLNDLEAGTHFFRAAITTAQVEKPLVAYTQCLPVRVVDRIAAANCSVARDVLKEARTILDESVAAGWPLDDARRYTVAQLAAEPSVAEVGAARHGDQVWVRFSSGLLGAVHPTDYVPTMPTVLFLEQGAPPANTKQPLSRQVVSILAPSEEAHPWEEKLAEPSCPPWNNLESSGQLALARRLAEAGLFFFAGRGGPVFGGLSDEARQALDSATLEFDAPSPAWTGWDHPGTQEVLWLADDWSCDSLATTFRKCYIAFDNSCKRDDLDPCGPDQECIITQGKDGMPSGVLFDRTQADLATGRLVLGPEGLGMTPSFLARYATEGLEGQLAWLGFPYSADSTSSAMELLAAKANGVIAHSGDVDPVAAEVSGNTFLTRALAEKLTPAAILPPLGSDLTDHEWRLFGRGNVNLNYSGLINPNFTDGTGASMRGWLREGYAEALSDWCDVGAASKQIAVVSNGLGYAVDRGEISQVFCLSPDKLVFEAWYNFVSHEFLDFCGNDYQEDRFELFIEDGDGQRVYLAATKKHDFIGINALCPCEAGDCGPCQQCGSAACDCGILFHPELDEELSLWPEECRFDKIAMGNAYSSGWRHTGEVALTNLGQGGFNKPVRIVLRVSDESSTKGNTAVLVDSLILK